MSGTTIPEEPDFSSACQPLAATTFQRLVDRIYIENFYDNNTVTPQMNEMFQNLKSTFAEMIGNNIWMDPGTKTEALKKLSQMGSEIGYPPSIFNDDQMRSMFDRLNISNEMSFPEMMKKVTTWQVRTQVLLLFDPPATDFKSSEANAFYDPTKNKMLIPAGFLQGAFFNSTWPVQMNYGAIGSIIGHEITHGFDNTGRKFDSQANLRDWWDVVTNNNYISKSQCLVDQYSAVEVRGTGGAHVNGQATLGENIADNGGMRAAFFALQKILQLENQSTTETSNLVRSTRKVAGLEQVTPQQMFFISRVFSLECEKTTPQSLISQVLTDSHTPSEPRTNMMASNMPEFATAFNCPLGSPMNPVKKCVVW